MKPTFLTLLLLCFALLCKAQHKFSAKGAVADTMATYKLANASLTLITQKDSMLVKHTRANAEGCFEMGNLPAGKFILLANYPGYADYTEAFILDSLNPQKDFGRLSMMLKSILLENVIIQGKTAAITIKGDTTEYNAGSYVIRPNSKVEELLRQLPGIEVDRSGKITAQGQNVNRVLVDGEEFFGADPTLATRNIRGDMVDKVQLYDKKSDQAAFTGIDDGQRSKTINLKLKENKRKGVFGKALAAAGATGFYETQLNANAFNGKKKVSFFGSLYNTSSFDMLSASVESPDYSRGAGNFNMGTADGFSVGGGAGGIPVNYNSGLRYENKWKKLGLVSNYKIAGMLNEGLMSNLSINALPGRTIKTATGVESSSSSLGHQVDGTLNMQLDPSATLKLTVTGSIKNSSSDDAFGDSTQRDDGSFLNKGKRDISNDGAAKGFGTTVFWAKLFKKKGRTLSLDLRQSLNRSSVTGYLNAVNEFYNEQQTLDSVVYVDQYKSGEATRSAVVSSLSYSEPLFKHFAMVLNYGLSLVGSQEDRRSFNKDANGNFTELDLRFSNNFKFNQQTNNGGLSFNYNKGKSLLNFGARVTSVSMRQVDLYQNLRLGRNFINWNPNAAFSYNFKQNASIRISYAGGTQQPAIEQIQPYRVNINPLILIVGNPDLKPAFSNSIGVNYNANQTVSEQNITVNGTFSFNNNPVSNSSVTNNAGVTINQAVNLKNVRPVRFGINGNLGRKVGGIMLSLSLSTEGNKNYSLSNQKLNTSSYIRYVVGPGILKHSENYRYRITFSPVYTSSSSMVLGLKTDNSSWGTTGITELMIRLPWNMVLEGQAEYQSTGRSQAFDKRQSRMVVDASFSKKFLKSESLVFSIKGRDLLNQNTGFFRNVMDNIVTQGEYTALRRYFLFSLSWDFNKMGGA